MKKILFFFLLLFLPYYVFAFEIKSENAILYNLNDNTILYEVKADEKVSIASMTKIMTALIAIENIDNLNDKVIMTSDMFKNLKEENASVAGFSVGETVTYYDLLYGLLLPSGADAAQALALTTSDSIDNFVSKMNQKVKELNLTNTHFANPTGLDDEDNYATVKDVALILQEALKNEEFKKIFTTKKYITSNKIHTFYATISKASIDTSFIDGSKTGFTYDAGLCMASIAHYNGVEYLLVTAHAPYDNRTNHIVDAKTIYNYYFENYEYRTVLEANTHLLTVTLDDGRKIEYYANNDIKKYLRKDCEIKSEYSGVSTVTTSNNINSKLGVYTIKCDDDIIYQKDILLVQNYSTSNINYKLIIIIGFCLLILLTIILLVIFNIRRKREIFKCGRNKKGTKKCY